MQGAVAAMTRDSDTDADLYAARQFENPRNVFAHRHSTGPELIQQVGVRLHGFVAGVGTGGTLMACRPRAAGSRLRHGGRPGGADGDLRCGRPPPRSSAGYRASSRA
jgi:hypothetical protein